MLDEYELRKINEHKLSVQRRISTSVIISNSEAMLMVAGYLKGILDSCLRREKLEDAEHIKATLRYFLDEEEFDQL